MLVGHAIGAFFSERTHEYQHYEDSETNGNHKLVESILIIPIPLDDILLRPRYAAPSSMQNRLLEH